MKKLFAILMALMALGFTQCKPTPDDGASGSENGDGEKVRIVCEIPMGGGSRSDFTNLLKNGKVNWNDGGEYVYLAVHGDKPQIIKLESYIKGQGPREYLEFEGLVEKDLIKEKTSYDIWYFGSSHQVGNANYELKDNVLSGSIATQSGRLSDLGDCHIATASVTPTLTQNGEEIRLSLNGQLKNQIAILLLNLKNVDELYGDAIIGTKYTLAYNSDEDKFEFKVEEDRESKIAVQKAEGISYIALLPNSAENTEIRYNDEHNKVYECILHGSIEANNFYYKTASDGTTIEALAWSTVSSGDEEHGDHVYHYVDLGLPSGTLWATRNVGADTIYEYGEYYAWGEIAKKDNYTYAECTTNDISKDISGDPNYDVAAAKWGDEWRVPTDAEQNELYSYCRMEIVKMPTPVTEDTPNGFVLGYMFTSTINGNHIFLPAAGYYDGEQYYDEVTGEPNPIPEGGLYRINEYGHYLSSTPCSGWNAGAELLHFEIRQDGESYKGYVSADYSAYRYYGCSVRPVLKKKAHELDHNHK